MFHWRLQYSDYSPYTGFTVFVGFVLLLSAICSGVELILKEARWFRVVALTHVACLVVLINGFWYDNTLWFPLAIVVVCEIAIYEKYPLNIAGNSLLVLLIIGVWIKSADRIEGITPASDSLALLLVGAAVVVATGLVTRYRSESIKHLQEIRRLDNAVREITATSRNYLRQAYEASDRSTQEERERITRDLHDGVGYTLTNLIMMIHSARASIEVDPTGASRTLDAAHEQAQQGMAAARRALYDLRQKEVATAYGLTRIANVVKNFEIATGIDVNVSYRNCPVTFGSRIDDVVVHLVEEALTNSFRHGKASRIWMDLWVEDIDLEVTISDDGIGSIAVKDGIGVTGMRQRIGRLGGTLDATSSGAGFEIRARIPLLE